MGKMLNYINYYFWLCMAVLLFVGIIVGTGLVEKANRVLIKIGIRRKL